MDRVLGIPVVIIGFYGEDLTIAIPLKGSVTEIGTVFICDFKKHVFVTNAAIMITKDVCTVDYLLVLWVFESVLDQARNGKDSDMNLSVDTSTFKRQLVINSRRDTIETSGLKSNKLHSMH